jgi:3-phosphoshikimate 1-carboxyvinyltransferase
MAAPLATGQGGIEIVITDELVSQPYVDMTVKLMERFGVKVEQLDGLTHMRIPPGQTCVAKVCCAAECCVQCYDR